MQGGWKEDAKGNKTAKWNPKKGTYGDWEAVSFTPSTTGTVVPQANDGMNTASAGAQPVSAPVSMAMGYVGADYDGYSMHSNGTSRTSDAASFGGAFALPVCSYSVIQVDGDYSRLSPGQGAPRTNAWDGDAHYSYKVEPNIPIGGFVRRFFQ